MNPLSYYTRQKDSWTDEEIQQVKEEYEIKQMNIIAIGDNYSVEFDCGEIFGIVNYCVHILSRSPTMDSGLLAELISFANNTLDLNIYNNPFNKTNQTGCW